MTDRVNKELKKLQELKFISLQKLNYVKCVNRNDEDYYNLTDVQKNCTGTRVVLKNVELTTCNTCNRIIETQNKKIFTSNLVKIKCLNIRLHLIEKIRGILDPQKSDNSHIILKNNGNVHKICFLDLCQDIECKTSFYYGDYILYAYCDYNERINAENVVWIIDLLTISDDAIVDFIFSRAPSIKIQNIEQKINDYIDKIDEHQFEEFIKSLLNYIADHPKEYNEGINFLKKYSGSILASFTFKIGGAGKVDGRIVNLNEYFETALKSNISLEFKHSDSKHYLTTSISHKDIKQLIAQSYEEPGALFSNRERIVGNSIDELHRFKQKKGFWKYVVIHRPLLKLFISLFASEFWNDPNCLYHV